ncbi:B-cell receptor CD22-like isoform X2 [Mixophyes fleayi]|uniref:B-cell receptor CD22-like isoform X2 n=1 Tax=Mixophyes fleayi TaxID=3061075 RepID=UPI003F4DE9B1
MSQLSICLKQSLFLSIFQDSDKYKWSFTFPETIKALKNSDVVIPCTFTAPSDYGEVHVIWFKYHLLNYPQIYNGKDQSKVIEEYRSRTSLVANGTNNCSLRINDVRRTEKYYPGIDEDINSYNLNNDQYVKVQLSGSEDKDWSFTIPYTIVAFKGSCVEIPCTFTHPINAKDFNFFWYLRRRTGLPQIFNNRTSTDILPEYNGRTFLVGYTKNNCTLRINNVTEREQYFPGINEDINSYELNDGKFTRVLVSDNPPMPLITGMEEMEEKKTVKIVCSLNYTCASSPPSLKLNKVGHERTVRYKDISPGYWIMETEMSYIPSYTEDNTLIECIATFPNNITSTRKDTLHIKYGPKNTTISIVENTKTKEGDNVTLRCTSQANPPVTHYIWYKIGKPKTLLPEHEDKITVRNVTSEKYICSASNGIGTADSQMFEFTNQSGNGNDYLPVIIGSAAGLGFITLVILIFCIFRRKQNSSVSKITKTAKSIEEEIPMNDHFYGNVCMQNNKDIPEELYTRDSSHGIYDNEIERAKNTRQTKDNQDESDGILYTLVELPPPSQGPKQAKKFEEMEYSVVKY